jgi:DNA-directed RNA polymerase specialized sigma24 family protein
MPVEQLTYGQIAERLGVTSEAARAIAKRNRLPRSRQ